jgi:HlyD family secretion protein
VTIISVPNPTLKLKPGMTATVTVEIARASNVLRLPNAALRLRPSEDVLKALGVTDSGDRHAAVWVSEKGRLERVPVQVTITDGTVTAMASGALREGAQVVTAVTSSLTTGTTSSPLLPFGGRGGPRGGPPRQSGR